MPDILDKDLKDLIKLLDQIAFTKSFYFSPTDVAKADRLRKLLRGTHGPEEEISKAATDDS